MLISDIDAFLNSYEPEWRTVNVSEGLATQLNVTLKRGTRFVESHVSPASKVSEQSIHLGPEPPHFSRSHGIIGVPRSTFVIVFGSIFLTVSVALICIYNFVTQRRNHKYGFYRIDGNGPIFADDDEEPLTKGKKSLLTREYKDNLSDSETTSEDELFCVNNQMVNSKSQLPLPVRPYHD